MASPLEEQLYSLISSLSHDTAAAAIDTLLKITDNLLTHPFEDQYKRIRITNKAFSQKVWQYPAGRQFLMLAGWTEAGEYLVYIEDQSTTLKTVEILRTIKSKSFSEVSTPASNGATAVPVFINKEEEEREHQERIERAKKLREASRKQQEERDRISHQIQADRREANQREALPSVMKKPSSNEPQVTRFGDIGVDLNKGG